MKASAACFGVFLSIILPLGSSHQQANSWRGLVLDQSTPEMAEALLGTPSKQEQNKKFRTRTKLDKVLDDELRFTKTTYEKRSGVDRLSLYFLDGELAVVEIDLDKKLKPGQVADAYNLEFWPLLVFGDLGAALTGLRLKPDLSLEVRVRFPAAYEILAVAPEAIVLGRVGNAGVGTTLLYAAGGGTTYEPGNASTYPGDVYMLYLISRAVRRQLEENPATEVLRSEPD